MPKTPTFEDYLDQCVATLGFPGEPTKAEQAYTFNLRSAHQWVTTGERLAGIISHLNKLSHEFANGRSDLLFYPSEVPADLYFAKKPFKSAIHKIYRRNVVFNKQYPDPPNDGAIDSNKLYDEIDDLIRTRIVCKYMDGPKFVCQRLREYCDEVRIPFLYRDITTDAGYYAWHFYFQSPVELMLAGEVHVRDMWVEIQLTTQLAEVITSLTHGLYSERREGRGGVKSSDWKWDAGSQRFRSAYLGHGLHLLEGVIQTFRDDVLKMDALPVGTEVAGDEHEAQAEAPVDADTEPTPPREE